uniref:Uncharacterized protein n=1 Tax=Anser brachyrhynchus TaxID=132585 RepID=A0A8B9ID62_9AVES
MAAARRLLGLLAPLAWARPAGGAAPAGGGWWGAGPGAAGRAPSGAGTERGGASRCRQAGAVPEEPRCTVERADAALTSALFLQRTGRGGPFPPLRAMKVLSALLGSHKPPLLRATSQGSSEHCAPRRQEPSRLPSRGSTGRGKAMCPRPALPEGPWAPRAEGGQTGRE